MFNTDLVEQLIDRMGIEGWGIYVALLMRMRQDDELTVLCSDSSVAAMARRWNTTPERVTEVVQQSGLLVPSAQKEQRFSSPYLDRVMAPLWAKRGDALRPVSKPKARTVHRAPDGRFTAKPSIEEKSRAEEENNSNSCKEPEPASVELCPILPWQSLVDEMTADTFWMELVGMRSGLAQLYVDHRAEIVELFRQHIRLYDKGGGLLRLQDVKQYFANYLAAGSRTCQGVRDSLLNNIRQRQTDAQISPHERLVDGQRTYLGRPIPNDAPPRPDDFAVWDEEKSKWTR